MTTSHIIDSLPAKTFFFGGATMASTYTAVLSDPHKLASTACAVASLVFTLMNIYTWAEQRRKVRLGDLSKSLAVSSTNKLEKDKSDEHS